MSKGKKCSPLRTADGAAPPKLGMPKFAHGSPFVTGPGTGTSDSITARLSKGEAVLPADTVRALGPGTIQALINETHTPARSGVRNGFANGTSLIDPRYPDDQQGPSVSTRVVQPALPRQVQPSTTPVVQPSRARDFDYAERWRNPRNDTQPAPMPDPRYPGGQQGPSVSTRMAPQGQPVDPAREARAQSMRAVNPSGLDPRNDTFNVMGTRPIQTVSVPNLQPRSPAGSALAKDMNERWLNPAGLNPSNDTFNVMGTRPTGQAGAPSAPSAPGVLRSWWNAIKSEEMPDTRAVLHGSGEDISGAINRGRYGEAAGHTLRGALALPLSISNDVLGPSIRMLAGDGSRSHIRDFGSAIMGKEVQARPAGGVTGAPTITAGPNLDPSVPNPTDQRLAAGTQMGVGMDTGPRMGNDPGREVAGAEGVRRFGNTYSNVPGDNRNAFKGGAVSTVPTSPEALDRMQRAAAIEADTNKMRMGLRDYGDANYYTTGAGAQGGAKAVILGSDTGPDLLSPEYRAKRERDMNMDGVTKGLSKRQRANFIRETEANERNNATQLETTRMNNETARANTDAYTRATMRGQDLTYGAQIRGQDTTARTAAAQAQISQRNTDRQYRLDVARVGAEEAKTRFDQRTKMVDETSKRLASMAPVVDGKPDPEWQARAMEGMNSMVAERQKSLEAELQRNPGNAKAAQELDAIERGGIGVLDEKDIRKLVVGTNLRPVADKGAGMFSRGSTSGSTQPVTGLRKQEGAFSNSYVTPQGDVIPESRLRSGGYGPFRWGGTMNPDYKILEE